MNADQQRTLDRITYGLNRLGIDYEVLHAMADGKAVVTISKNKTVSNYILGEDGLILRKHSVPR